MTSSGEEEWLRDTNCKYKRDVQMVAKRSTPPYIYGQSGIHVASVSIVHLTTGTPCHQLLRRRPPEPRALPTIPRRNLKNGNVTYSDPEPTGLADRPNPNARQFFRSFNDPVKMAWKQYTDPKTKAKYWYNIFTNEVRLSFKNESMDDAQNDTSARIGWRLGT